MFVKVVSECEQPGGEIKIVTVHHHFGRYEFPLKRRLTRRADGCWAMTPKDARDFQEALRRFKRKALGLPTPKQIKELREGLGISQREASRIFGGGSRSFQKYESGTEVIGTAMARLLRLVSRRPELVSELKDLGKW